MNFISILVNNLPKFYKIPKIQFIWLNQLCQYFEKDKLYIESACSKSNILTIILEHLEKTKINYLTESEILELKSLSSISIPKDLDLSNIYSIEFKEENVLLLIERIIQILNQAEYYEHQSKFSNILNQIYQRKGINYHLKEIKEETRYFPMYYRITIFSPLFGTEDGISYIYKMGKFVKLYQVVKMIKSLISDLAPIELIDHSGKVDKGNLSNERIYVQITNVKVYNNDEKTLFEKNHKISKFFFMSPYTENGKGKTIEDTYLKRTILTIENSFPFMCIRSKIISEDYEILTPIEAGIKMIEEKNKLIQEALNSMDISQIQLHLQGSVVANVNGGPLDIVQTFLGYPEKYNEKHIEILKYHCKTFIHLNKNALEKNQEMIKESSGNQYEFHQLCLNGFIKIQNVFNKFL